MPTMLQQVQKVIAEELGTTPERVTPEKRLRDDLGADSLDEVELVMAFEREFDLDISDEDAEKLRTVSDYTNYLAQRAPRAA